MVKHLALSLIRIAYLIFLFSLSIAPQTPAIRQEREFIEATSRIASFNLQRGGSAIIPIQIRLTKDKLQLIEEVIQSSEDAYRHPELLLELADKLGFRGDDIATLRVLDMVSSASCQRGEHEGALESVQRVVDATEGLRARKSPQSPQAAAIAWQACKRLVSQPLRGSSQQQVDLLGQALLLCPPTSVSELLSLWREAEEKLGRQASRPLSRINTSSPLGNALNLGQAGVSSYLDRPASSGSLSPAAALDTIVYGREGGVRDRLQSGMTSGLRWLVEGS